MDLRETALRQLTRRVGIPITNAHLWIPAATTLDANNPRGAPRTLHR